VVRPPIGTNCWFSIICGIALLLCALSVPVETSYAPKARGNSNSHFRKFAPPSGCPGVVITAATQRGAIINACRSEIMEEEEDESAYSFVCLVLPALIAPDGVPKFLSDPPPGNSPPRTVALPLRC